MEYLKSGWKTVVGTQPSVMDEQPNAAETVERLVERVETSTLLEDRRDACRALKSLSKTYRLEVGAQAMDALLFVLQNDQSDNEIVALCLETLNNIIGNIEDVEQTESGTDLGVQFTEIFIKRKENVQLVIDLLAEFDFKIRWPTIKLLYSLLRNKLRECQDCILTYPMGISRMMDLLLDPREVIRNDALLLLVYLTKNNTNIQKIVAFENAFDRILDIITSEGCSDGGIIVEDCLSILLNLLKTNTSNQNFFKEGSYINRLIPFLDFSFDTSWNPQKINNLLLMFKVIRCLVSPKNPFQVTNACQNVLNQNEVLQKLCAILMSNGIPTEILTETMNCVAEVIRGNQVNQSYFSRVNAPIEPPKQVIVILLMSMINEKQPFELRCAVLYCFQCFLYKNDLGQAQIVETLLLTSSEVPMAAAGQLLCNGFFSQDPLSNWFVAVSLSYTLLGNVTQKVQLLRVLLTNDNTSQSTSLLSYCSTLLQQGGHYQRRVSLLMLLSIWLTNSPEAVSNFLSISTNVPFLTSQVGLIESDEVELIIQGLCAFLLGICICYNNNSVPSFTKDDLCQIITDRIGREIFVDKISLISKNEKFSQAIQKPQISYRKASDVLFDYEFCNLFRNLEGTILKIIQPSNDNQNNNPESSLLNEDHKLLMKYKELIRQQDEQLTSLKKQLTELKTRNEYLTMQSSEQQSTIQQLRDQVALLKAQKSAYYDPNPTAVTSTNPVIYPNNSNNNPENYHNSFNNSSYPNDTSQNNIPYVEQLTNQMESLQVDGNQVQLSTDNVDKTDEKTAQQIDYLMNENRRLQEIIDQYKSWEQYYGYYYSNPQNSSIENWTSKTNASAENWSTKVNESTSDISRILSDDIPEIQQKPDSINNSEQVSKLKAELESIKKEQNDLLSLLGDQNLKLQFYEKEFKDRSLNVITETYDQPQQSSMEAQQNISTENTDTSGFSSVQNSQINHISPSITNDLSSTANITIDSSTNNSNQFTPSIISSAPENHHYSYPEFNNIDATNSIHYYIPSDSTSHTTTTTNVNDHSYSG